MHLYPMNIIRRRREIIKKKWWGWIMTHLKWICDSIARGPKQC